MVELKGKGACGGVVRGRLYYYKRASGTVKRQSVADPAAEQARLEVAKEQAIAQLAELYEVALGEVGEQGATLFEIHQMMLEDDDYCDSIANIIARQSVNAEYAVAVTSDNFAKMFSDMDDDYMKERAADVRDVSDRLIGILLGKTQQGIESDEPVIVAAEDLAPSETVQFDKSKILGFVTAQGSTNSHTAILARTMGIPAVVGVGEALTEELDGQETFVDGGEGKAYIDPTPEVVARLEAVQEKERRQKLLLKELHGQPSVTRDGKEVKVMANIGSPGDLGAVLQNDAEGVGLFRSEFLYLEQNDYPSEERLLGAYRTVAETLAGKPVIIRTLDIGADKQADYFNLPAEENPALGLRAIRLCLTRREMFKTQLRAVYRASAFGKIGMMFPMIASLWEVREAKKMAAEVREELAAAGLRFDPDVELGIMIETPAAAVISDLLAQEVDFFSIGTNDLTQYTLAVDRQNASLEPFCDTHHEAVLRLIELVCKNAHEAGIWVGICGELGADLALTERFARMGVDELSVSPASVLPVRKKIRESTATE